VEENGELEVPEQGEASDGIEVFWWRWGNLTPETVEATVPDGTRAKPVWQLDGKRLGFDRGLLRGTQLFVDCTPQWKPIGLSK